MFTPEGLCIKPASVGLGVVASKPWSKGTLVGEFVGVEMLKTDFRRIYGKDIRYTYYTEQNFPNTKVRVAKDIRNFITYINESAVPNVYLKRYNLYCLKDISEGEELFLRYSKPYPRDYEIHFGKN